MTLGILEDLGWHPIYCAADEFTLNICNPVTLTPTPTSTLTPTPTITPTITPTVTVTPTTTTLNWYGIEASGTAETALTAAAFAGSIHNYTSINGVSLQGLSAGDSLIFQAVTLGHIPIHYDIAVNNVLSGVLTILSPLDANGIPVSPLSPGTDIYYNSLNTSLVGVIVAGSNVINLQ